MTLMQQTDRQIFHEALRPSLHNKATRLRIHSIRETSAAGSGHVTSSCSAAEIAAVLFFSVMRYDPSNPQYRGNDRFVLSKGHASPLLYAIWAEAGFLSQDELSRLRTLESDLEGHPTPRLPFVDVATGSLGQGLSAGAGMAFSAKHLEGNDVRIYVLMGDAEVAEGAVWEAIQFACLHRLDNLCVVVDVNRLGQSGPTMFEHDLAAYEARWSAFGWHTVAVDGHDIGALLAAFDAAKSPTGKPTVVLARTIKGKGLPTVEDKEGKHGKPLDEADVGPTIRELEGQLIPDAPEPPIPEPIQTTSDEWSRQVEPMPPPSYTRGEEVATRTAFGNALVALGRVNPRVVGLDGDVKDSTRMQKFADEYPERFIECYIAEQNMVGVATGLAACGRIPYAATFGCFLTRAHDFIRMAAISDANIKLMGSHAGVSIGKDGPSQMALEDIAMMAAQPNVTVLYPADAVAAHWLTAWAAEQHGMVYIRTTRGKTPVLYDNEETFAIGGCKILRESDDDQMTIVAAGITLFLALEAYEQLRAEGIQARVVDLYSIQPIDRDRLVDCARATHGRIVTIEDHYAHGGLGDAVQSALSRERVRVHKLAVREIPHSGTSEKLLDRYGISSRALVEAVKQWDEDWRPTAQAIPRHSG